MITYEQFSKAVIKKRYRIDDYIYLQILLRNEETNEIILLDLPYSLYKLQKKFRFIIPPEYTIYHKDGNKKNYKIKNIGLTTEDGKKFNIDSEYFRSSKYFDDDKVDIILF